MILGFISLFLIVFQAQITNICIPKSVGATWHPCKDEYKEETDSQDKGRKLLQLLDSGFGSRRILAAKEIDKCTEEVNSMIFFLFLFYNNFKIRLFLFYVSKYVGILV